MATQEQTVRNSAAGLSVGATWPATPTEGNLLIAVVAIAALDSDENPGSIPEYTLVSDQVISGTGDEHIMVFAKFSEGDEATETYTHGTSSPRAIHIHLVEISTPPAGTIRAVGTNESVAIYDHDAEATLDNSPWDTGPLTGEGIMIIAYNTNGTTNASGWTVGSSFALLAQPLNDDDASIVGWKQSSEVETVELAGGNGRSGLSVLVNVLQAVTGGGGGGRLAIDIGIKV